MAEVEAKNTNVGQMTCGSLLKNLQNIWDEVGESDEERDKMLLQIDQECLNVYKKKVDQAVNLRATLLQTLADARVELSNLLAALGEKTYLDIPEKTTGTIKEQLAAIAPALEKLWIQKDERIEEFSDVQSQIQKICAEITGTSEQVANPSVDESDLSLKKLDDFHDQLQDLQKEKSERLHKILEFVSIVHDLCAVLGLDFLTTVTDVHASLNDSTGVQSKSISNETLSRLAKTVLALKEDKQQRLQKLQELATQLVDLWNLMDTPPEERSLFDHVTCNILASVDEVTIPGSLALDLIEQVEVEVERLDQLKASKMKEIAFRKQAELEDIFTHAHIEIDTEAARERILSLIDSGNVEPAELLADMDNQIVKATEEALSRKDILDKVEKWMSVCEEESWLDDYMRDDKRYNASRGAHLNLKRAEKARVLANKIPGLVESLVAKIHSWEQERGITFTCDGVPLLEMLDEYAMLRHDRDEEKKRMKMEGTLKRSRIEGMAVPRSECSRRRPGRIVEEEVPQAHPQFSQPIHQYRLPTPDLSDASDSSSQRMYGSRLDEFSIPSSYDEERDEAANDGSPYHDDLIPSYRSHVAHSIWNGEERGVLKIHHRFMTVKTWNVVRADAAALIEDSGLGGLPSLMYDSLDAPLICAFIERWYPETNSFHMPFGEMTITLHDTHFILGLPVVGEPVCPSCDGNSALTLTTLANALGIPNQTELKAATSWLNQSVKLTAMRMIAMSEGIQPSKFARIYLWWVLTSTLFVDKTKTHGYASFIELLRRPEAAQRYAWGAGALANLYRELGTASRAGCRQVAGCMTLLQAWIYAYFPRLRPQARQSWTPDEPFASLWIPVGGRGGVAEQALQEYRMQLDNLTEGSVEWLPFGAQPGARIPISCFRGIIHCRSINEPYMPDRVARQFGYVQTIPPLPIRPSSCNMPENPKAYAVKHDPSHWVFTSPVGYYNHIFDTCQVAEVSSACSETYMEWYLERTHPKVRRVEDEDDDEDEQPYEPDEHGMLQRIAGLVAPYHPQVYGSTSDEGYHVLAKIAKITERLMPNMHISGRGRSYR